MTTYRVDYISKHDDRLNPAPIVIYDLTRTAAMSKARQLSRTHGSAYAVATDLSDDTGQRVYSDGLFSHQDGAF